MDGFDATLEGMADQLEDTGRYRVLRRLDRDAMTAPTLAADAPAAEGARTALYIDLETTGLDGARDEIIEIAIVPFDYAADGRVLGVRPAYAAFQDPGRPIPAAVTEVTGITDAMVAGAAIDGAAVGRLADGAALAVAHNAGFDRPFMERFDPRFAELPWACSMQEVDWTGEGFDGRKLGHLAMQSGFFFPGHRAELDCLAGVELLTRRLPTSGAPAMARLLETARLGRLRLWATDAPFDAKDALKARGYRWSGGEGAQPRGWWCDLEEADAADEAAWLRSEVYRGDAEVTAARVTARERHSARPPATLRRLALSALPLAAARAPARRDAA